MIIKRTKNAAVASSKEKANTVNKKEPIADDGMNARDFAAFLVMCTRILADEVYPCKQQSQTAERRILKAFSRGWASIAEKMRRRKHGENSK